MAECQSECHSAWQVANLPHLEKVDQDKDRRFSCLCKTIAECVSIHSAATWLMDNQPWDFMAVYYDAIDHFCHRFMKYLPPRRPWNTEEDFELYSNVVSTAHVLRDQMLGTLLEKAREHQCGPDVRPRVSSRPEPPASDSGLSGGTGGRAQPLPNLRDGRAGH